MAIEVAMPALSPTMEAGTLARWLVKEGDVVAAGALLAEVETDKATMELEAAEGGVIARLLVAEGTEEVRVGAPVALMTPAGKGAAQASGNDPHTETDRAPAAGVTPPPIPATVPIVVPEPLSGQKTSPLARRMATAAGVDLTGVKGSGPRGRIVAADIGLPGRVDGRTPVSQPKPLPQAPEGPSPATPHRAVKLSSMRRTIARRLTESKQSAPHFYLGVDVRMDPLFAFRADLNAAAAEAGVKVSINDLFIKALAVALEDTPDANVQFAGDRLLQFERVDVSVAVATPGGLVTP